jgi:hypothetical protein
MGVKAGFGVCGSLSRANPWEAFHYYPLPGAVVKYMVYGFLSLSFGSRTSLF